MAWYDKANQCWRGIVRPNGRKGKRIMKRFDAEHEAIEWEQQMKGLVGQGVHPDMTIEKLAARYMVHKIKDRTSPRTQFDYESILDLHILPMLGDRVVRELKLPDIENWYAKTLANIRDRTGKPGVSTINKASTLLYGVLKYGVALELLTKNPVDGIDRASWRPEEKRCYDLDQLGRLLQASQQPYQAMFAFGSLAGLMPSEWLAVSWADVDLDNSVLHVRYGMTMNRERRYERGATKTDYRVRQLPMPPVLVDEIKKYRDWSQVERDRLCTPTSLLFVTASGRPMSKDNVRRDGWWPAVKRAKLPPAHMNSLRHSYQTIISNTVSEGAFERLAGHARGSTVGRRFYVHKTALGARELVDSAFRVNNRVNIEHSEGGPEETQVSESRVNTTQWGRSSVGRASRSQCEGRGFDSLRLHQ